MHGGGGGGGGREGPTRPPGKDRVKRPCGPSIFFFDRKIPHESSFQQNISLIPEHYGNVDETKPIVFLQIFGVVLLISVVNGFAEKKRHLTENSTWSDCGSI